MVQKMDWRMLTGLLLILAGGIFLIDAVTTLEIGGLVWALLFAAAGALFLVHFSRSRENWWAIIPGVVLLGLAVIIAIGELAPGLAGQLGGLIFLGGIGLSFLIVYLMRREFWWAIIPAGVLLTLAVVAWIGSTSLAENGELIPVVFFLGLAATFALVGLLPVQQGRMTWAFIPAGILAAIAVIVGFTAIEWINYVWPVALVLLGLFLIYRTVARR